MAAVLQNSVNEVSWSNRSKIQLNKFLSSKSGSCLKKQQSEKTRSSIWLKVPAGAAYSAVEQCRLIHAQENVTVCRFPPQSVPFCTQLWCEEEDTCFSSGDPPAAGTICGVHKWCIGGQCVQMEESMDSVDGAWGTWTPWSSCSRSCGGGISTSTRKCDSPTPRKGGNFCDGSSSSPFLTN